MIEIGALVEVSVDANPQTIFGVHQSSRVLGADERLLVSEPFKQPIQNRLSRDSAGAWLWAIPLPPCGDMPTQYHPKFLMALLSSLAAKAHNCDKENFLRWQFPSIQFKTDEWTRRSMALNGMRMSTEYFASDSPRILQLVEQRLQAGQADVVHDVVLYLMQGVLDLRMAADEERVLQAESLAAYLGLDALRVQELLLDWPVRISQIQREIEAGFAGVPRQVVNLALLLENQVARFSAATHELKNQEDRVLGLIDAVIMRLYNHDSSDC